MKEISQPNPVDEGSPASQSLAPLDAGTRREFGLVSIVSGVTLPLLNRPLLKFGDQVAQLSTIFKNAHPLLTKEGIEIVYELISKGADYWKNHRDLEDYSHEKRSLTPAEEADRYEHFFRRFEHMKVTSELFDRAFHQEEKDPPFTEVIKDYEKHIREHFLQVEEDIQKLMRKYISDPDSRRPLILRLEELRRDIFLTKELEKDIDGLEDKMDDLRWDIESQIGKEWTYPIGLIMSEIRDDCSPDDVISLLVDDDDDDPETESLRNVIRQYEPIARDIEQHKRFNPRGTYLYSGRGADIFGSLKGLAAAAGDTSKDDSGDEAGFILSQFHLTFLDWHSARLFPHGDKDSVKEHLGRLFSIFCTPSYQYNITNHHGFDRESKSYYSSEESRLACMANPDSGVTHHLLDIQRKHQCYKTMRSALRNAWPNMVSQLGRAGVFKSVEDSLRVCEKVLNEFLKEISPKTPERQAEPRSLEEVFLSTDLRAYITAVRLHEAKVRSAQSKYLPN